MCIQHISEKRVKYVVFIRLQTWYAFKSRMKLLHISTQAGEQSEKAGAAGYLIYCSQKINYFCSKLSSDEIFSVYIVLLFCWAFQLPSVPLDCRRAPSFIFKLHQPLLQLQGSIALFPQSIPYLTGAGKAVFP